MEDPPVSIEHPDAAAVDDLADLWVALASDQRAHDSHILPESNREIIRDTLAQHVVTGGVRVARCSGDVVGFVTFDLERGVYEQDAARGVVRNVYVVPEYRGRGVGSALMDAAEASLREAGASVVSLEAMAANERAREFYRERGYAPHRVQFEKSVGTGSDEDTGEGGNSGRDDAGDSGNASDLGASADPETAAGSEGSGDPGAAVENDTHTKED